MFSFIFLYLNNRIFYSSHTVNFIFRLNSQFLFHSSSFITFYHFFHHLNKFMTENQFMRSWKQLFMEPLENCSYYKYKGRSTFDCSLNHIHEKNIITMITSFSGENTENSLNRFGIYFHVSTFLFLFWIIFSTKPYDSPEFSLACYTHSFIIFLII